MKRKEIERYEAKQIRQELHRLVDDLSDHEVVRFHKIVQNYEKIDEFLNFIRTLR